MWLLCEHYKLCQFTLHITKLCNPAGINRQVLHSIVCHISDFNWMCWQRFGKLPNASPLCGSASLCLCVSDIHSFKLDSASGSQLICSFALQVTSASTRSASTPSHPAGSDLNVSFMSPNSQWGARIHSQAPPCWQVNIFPLTCTTVKWMRNLEGFN